MDFSFSNRVRAIDNLLIRELEGESVLLNLDTESYFGLDDVATQMWALLTTSESIQAAYEALMKQYDVSEAALREDLETLIKELSEHGLVEIEER
jgi:hypothetical protein